MKQVADIVGLFFKKSDPKETKAWNKKHVGFNTDD